MFKYTRHTNNSRIGFYKQISIAEKFGVKMVPVKSVEPRYNSFGINHNIRYRSKLLLLGFSKSLLVLILQ